MDNANSSPAQGNRESRPKLFRAGPAVLALAGAAGLFWLLFLFFRAPDCESLSGVRADEC